MTEARYTILTRADATHTQHRLHLQAKQNNLNHRAIGDL